MPQPDNTKTARAIGEGSTDHRSRVILDSSMTKIADRPLLLEERLLKIRGVVSVEINVFSGRIAVEFDPALVSLETIKDLISSKPGSK